jgi:peptidoglycan/xylan/chitin deacetylase (PgdA/CDA1 family)
MQGPVTVFFRYDDYSETSPLGLETRIVDVLRRNGACATFAVIPAVTEGSYHVVGERGCVPLGLAPAKRELLRQAADDAAVDVALHGWNHRTLSTASPHSEFVGLTVDDQLLKLARGHDLLHRVLDISPRVFVPPWNSYDVATLEALAQQGATGLSANRYGPCNDGNLLFAPITADVRELRQSIAAALECGDPDPIVGVLLHPYDFEESGDARGDYSCEALDADLRWLTRQPNVRVVSVSQLLQENDTMDAARYRANQPWVLEEISPPFLRTTGNTPFYLTTAGANRAGVRRVTATVITHVIGSLIGFGLGRVAAALLVSMPGLVSFGRYTVGASLVALIARVIFRREIGFRPTFVMAMLAGILVSAWLEP